MTATAGPRTGHGDGPPVRPVVEAPVYDQPPVPLQPSDQAPGQGVLAACPSSRPNPPARRSSRRPEAVTRAPPAGALGLRDGGGPDHPVAIDLDKPSRPGPRSQCRSSGGALHIDPEGLACSPHGRVDGDGMIRQAGAAGIFHHDQPARRRVSSANVPAGQRASVLALGLALQRP